MAPPPLPVRAAGQPTLQDYNNLRLYLVWAYDGEVKAAGRDYAVDTPHLTGIDFGVWLIRRGSVTVTSPTATERARAGQWMIPRLGPRHQVFSPDARILSVCFHATWPDESQLYDRSESLVWPARETPRLETAGVDLVRFVARHCRTPTGWLGDTPVTLDVQLRLQRKFLAWLTAFTAVMTAHGMAPTRFGQMDARIARALFLLDRHPLDQSLDEGRMAHEIGLSVSQLGRLFVQQLDTTPHRYFENRRLDHARRRLIDTVTPIKEIAYGLGFKRLSHFSAWFRRQTATSPRAFRQAIRRPTFARSYSGKQASRGRRISDSATNRSGARRPRGQSAGHD